MIPCKDAGTRRHKAQTPRLEAHMKNQDWKFDLQLFADGGAGAAGGEGGADTGAEGEAAVPVNPNRKQRKSNPLANVKYGIQPEQQAREASAAPQGEETPADPDAEWNAAKEKYRELYQRDTTNIVKERLKNSKQAEAQMEKLAPVLAGLAQKYGKDTTDLDGIIAAYTDDDSLYEQEAMERGLDVSVLKHIKQLEADKAASEAKAVAQRNQAHIQGLWEQGEALKQIFPGFDLWTELQNPQFMRLTSPEVGISVEDAYHLIHRKEIQAASAQIVAQKTQQKLSQAAASGVRRPSENGSQSVSSALDIRDDPSKWSKADREEVKRRARSGEKIFL